VHRPRPIRHKSVCPRLMPRMICRQLRPRPFGYAVVHFETRHLFLAVALRAECIYSAVHCAKALISLPAIQKLPAIAQDTGRC